MAKSEHPHKGEGSRPGNFKTLGTNMYGQGNQHLGEQQSSERGEPERRVPRNIPQGGGRYAGDSKR